MVKQKPAPNARSATKSRVATVQVRARVANVERETRARKALAEIRVLFRKSAESAWDLGHALGEFVQAKLHLALGYASFAQCLEGEKLLSENQAFKLIRVARRFSREELAKVGSVAKAHALIGYSDATEADDTPVGLLKADALIGGKRVSKASRDDIEQGAKAAMAQRKHAPPEDAGRVARAKADTSREKWVAKQLATLGWKATRMTTTGKRILVELDLAKIDEARG